MRLDHLLSKDWFCVGCGSLAVILSGPCGSGRAWGACLAEGWAAGRRALVCGVVGLSGAGMRDAPAVLLLPACVGSGVWWVSLRVCGGGMLSGFWGSAPWSPGPCSAALCGWWGVGVGGLVVNCIVDASILL